MSFGVPAPSPAGRPGYVAGVLIRAEDREGVTPTTRYRDYILTDYEPAGPTAGALHPVTVFRTLVRESGLYDIVWPVCSRVRKKLGPDQTVWAVKWGPGGPSVELYFYNFTRNGPGNAASAQAISPCLPEPRPPLPHPRLPYFMCSVELGPWGASSWRVYLGTGDRHRRQAGFSYRVDTNDLWMENHYWFYRSDDAQEREDALLRIRQSPRAGVGRAALYPDELRDCHTICFAVKPRCDGLYYSRVTTEQAANFFSRMDPPGTDVAALLREHADELRPVRWDIGFDVHAPLGSVVVPKYAIHGVF